MSSARCSSFKKGVSADASRRRRVDARVSVTKNKREEGLAKKRFSQSSSAPSLALVPVAAASASAANAQQYEVADIPRLAAQIRDPASPPSAVLDAQRGFRKLLSIEPKPPVEEVLATGVLAVFVAHLDAADDQLQFESAWSLTNIASTTHTRAVTAAGAVPGLVRLMQSKSADVREQCAWCLGNIAGDCAELRDLVIASGALNPMLMNLAQPETESILRNFTWSLSNLCRGKPLPQLAAVAPALPALAHLANSSDEEVLMDACWALSYLSDGENDRIKAVVKTGVVPRLVELLRHTDAKVKTPALRTLGNIVTGDDTDTQAAIDAGALALVAPLLLSPKRPVRKECLWMVSNVAAGTRKQIDALFEQRDIVPAVIKHGAEDAWEVQKEAAYVLGNLLSGGTNAHKQQLVEYGALTPLVALLTVQDSSVVLLALEGIEKILQLGQCGAESAASLVDQADGLDRIENLQSHANEEVYKAAVKIIEQYFGEEDESENMAPNAAGNGSSFAFGMPVAQPLPAGGFSFGAVQ